VQDAMCTDKTYQRGYFYTQRNEHFRLVLSFYRLNCLPYLSTCDILTFTFSAWLRSTYFEVRAILYSATVGRPRHGTCKLEMGNVLWNVHNVFLISVTFLILLFLYFHKYFTPVEVLHG